MIHFSHVNQHDTNSISRVVRHRKETFTTWHSSVLSRLAVQSSRFKPMSTTKLPPDIRAALKRLGNPYALTQVDGLVDEAPAQVAQVSLQPLSKPRTVRESARLASSQQDLFAQPSPPHDGTPSGNPYASLANIVDEPSSTAARSTPERVDSVSQADFDSGCRRIFSQYIPALERGRLRPEHRDFIDRNRTRAGGIRAKLLKALQKYDLSRLTLQPQFNRESESVTAQKLKEIEQSVGEDE